MSERATSKPATPPPTAERRAGWKTWLKSHPNVLRLGSVILFFCWWEWAARDVNPLFMTYPSAIFDAAVEMTRSGQLPSALLQSAGPFAIGLAISIVFGIVIGILLGSFWVLEYSTELFLSALYATPRVALVPLIILWAGLGIPGKVSIIVSLAIFPVIMNTYAGIKDVRGSLIEIGRAYCATEYQSFMKIILPAAVPYIMSGIRVAVGLAIIGLVVAEFFTAVSGLGGLIVTFSNNFATAKLFVPVVIVGALGAGLTQLVSLLERRFSGWRISERDRH
jgi:ABC-type nitrate/sulfonate/bicarbonate transport system permease component